MIGSLLLSSTLVVALPGASAESRGPAAVVPASPTLPTAVQHVVVIFMENSNASWVLQAGSYERYLRAQYAYASDFYSVKHGSNPDYLAATSGLTNSALKQYSTANVGSLATAAGLTWGAFEQSMPKPCDTSRPSKTAAYDSGHNPFVWYSNVYSPASYCDANDVGFAPLETDIAAGTMPNYALVVANQTNDAHNLCSGPAGTTTVSCGDAWLQSFLSPLLNSSAAWVRSTAFIITYDEANLSDTRGIGGTRGGGLVYTAVVGPCATPGYTSLTPWTTFSILTTTQWLLGLGGTGHHDSFTSYPPMESFFDNPGCGSSVASYTLTTSANPTVGGSVAPGSGSRYPAGTPVALSETPANGYAFVGWTGSGSGAYTGLAPDPSVTMNGNVTEVADFALGYAVTFSESGLASDTSWAATLAGHFISGTGATIGFAATNGTYAFTIAAVPGYSVSPTDGSVVVAGASATVPVTFTPGPPVIISFAASPSVIVVGASTTFAVSASGGSGPLSYTYTGLPPACASANADSLACTPSSAGSFAVEVQVTDGLDRSVFASASLTVNPGEGPLAVSAPVIDPNPSLVGTPTTFSVTASGGAPPYKYVWREYVKGILNPGDVSSFEGAPTTRGTWDISCVLTDSAGTSVISAVTVFVVGVAPPAGPVGGSLIPTTLPLLSDAPPPSAGILAFLFPHTGRVFAVLGRQ